MGSVIVNPSHCDWERYVCTCNRGDSVVPSDQDPYSALADIKHKIGECYRYRHLPSPDYNLQSFTLQLAEIMVFPLLQYKHRHEIPILGCQY